ncbi:hypothetical protein EDD86DRAFT_218944 [Gorgonomyces haynaldii]|nr:hypothetical protein EDD86DRAFT_218944 [Gorgonomyces haynaldii]
MTGLNSPTYAWISNRRIDNSIGDGWIQLSPLDTTNSDRKSFESAWNALYPSNNPLSLSVLEHVACLQLIIQGYQDLWLQNPSLVFGNLSLQITNRQLVHGHSLDTTGFSLWNQRNDLNVQIGSYNSTSLTVGSIVYAQGSTKKPDSTAIIDNTNVAFTSGFAIFFYICYVPTLITCIVCGLYSVFRPTRARFERIIIVIGLILSCLNCLVTLGYITTLKCILDTVSLHMGYILVNAALIVLLNKMITFYYGILWIHNGSDWSYLLEALCLIGVQVLIMVGSIASSVPVPVQISVGNNIMTSCQAQNGSGYLILLINDAAAGLYAAVLAFRVRQMRDDMNHAKWVGIIVYNQVVILAVTLFCIGSPVVRLNTQLDAHHLAMWMRQQRYWASMSSISQIASFPSKRKQSYTTTTHLDQSFSRVSRVSHMPIAKKQIPDAWCSISTASGLKSSDMVMNCNSFLPTSGDRSSPSGVLQTQTVILCSGGSSLHKNERDRSMTSGQ